MRKNLALLILVLLSLTACTNEDLLDDIADTVKIVTTIETSKDSRISIDDNGKGNFTNGDQILLYTNGSSPKTLTYNNSTWTPELNWNEIGPGQATFLAYYPQNPFTSWDGNDYVGIQTDQRKNNAYEKSDVLIAETTTNSGETVKLNFKHAMSRLTVKLTSNFLSDDDLANATIRFWTFPQMKFNKQKGTFDKPKYDSKEIFMKHIEAGTYKAIVCPHEMFEDWQTRQWMTISIKGKDYNYLAPKKLSNGNTFSRFESGKEIVLNINLKKKNPEENWPTNIDQVDWKNKTMWIYGLNDIPTTNLWGLYFDNQYKIIGLEWQPKYGWYDCTKIDPVNPQSPSHDSNMCWAASCSNLIYWWLDRNAEYLDRYGYNGPRVYKDAFDCEVFKYFKDHFTNEGLFIQAGLKWFFQGTTPLDNGDSASPLPNKNHKGFFKDLFENAQLLRVTSGSTLSDDLKQAYINKEAIGLSIHLKAGRGAHALNIWGAKFDENGEVYEIYITENNDNEEVTQGTSPMQPGKLCPAGIYPKKVKKINGSYWMESSTQGEYTIEIRDLIFLSPNYQAWENYFKTHPEK